MQERCGDRLASSEPSAVLRLLRLLKFASSLWIWLRKIAESNCRRSLANDASRGSLAPKVTWNAEVTLRVARSGGRPHICVPSLRTKYHGPRCVRGGMPKRQEHNGLSVPARMRFSQDLDFGPAPGVLPPPANRTARWMHATSTPRRSANCARTSCLAQEVSAIQDVHPKCKLAGAHQAAFPYGAPTACSLMSLPVDARMSELRRELHSGEEISAMSSKGEDRRGATPAA